MDGRTGNGRLRPSAVLGDLVRAAVPPLLPAALALAAACAALSAGTATGVPAAPVLPVLALVALVLGAPVSVAAALLVGAAALTGRRADADAVRRRAVRSAPLVLLWAVVLAAPVAALLPAGSPWITAAAAVALLPLLPALLLAVPVAVVTGCPLRRVLPATLSPRGLRALLGGLRSAVRVPGHTGARPSVAAPVPVALLLGAVAVAGFAWDAGSPVPEGGSDRTTVHIEAADGSEHRFEVDLAAPGGDERAAARVGGHTVDAYWRAGPAEGGSTLYLRVCPVSDTCEEKAAGGSGTLDVTAAGDGSFAVTAVDRGAPFTLVSCADPGCTRAVPAGPAAEPVVPTGPVTVEVEGPDSMRLVLLSCALTACPEPEAREREEGDRAVVTEPPAPADVIARRSGPAPSGTSGEPACAAPECAARA
ncbi:hypothetical protein SUDANB121_02890 [Nocardiopsis dassonvillei]|uniref:hypothetical protein n=1 Tax=Nocardiopsis dassonvillei TaxID=2014 RepID=UPI003F56C95D